MLDRLAFPAGFTADSYSVGVTRREKKCCEKEEERTRPLGMFPASHAALHPYSESRTGDPKRVSVR